MQIGFTLEPRRKQQASLVHTLRHNGRILFSPTESLVPLEWSGDMDRPKQSNQMIELNKSTRNEIRDSGDPSCLFRLGEISGIWVVSSLMNVSKEERVRERRVGKAYEEEELLIPPKSKYQIRDQFRSLEKSDDDAITAIFMSAFPSIEWR